MATLSFRIRTNKANNSIYIRFKQGNLFDIEVSTGIIVPKGKWSYKLQRIKYTENVDFNKLNKSLRELKVEIINIYSSDSIDGVIIDSKWLKEKTYAFLNKETQNKDVNKQLFFAAFFDYFILTAKKRLNNPKNPIKYRTIQHYQTTKNKIEAYEKYIGKKLTLQEISLKFHNDFIEYLENEESLNPNTIGGYIDVIRQVCDKADIKAYKINNDYKSSEFYSPSNITSDTYLTINEIHKINNHKLNKEHLDNARDWLIISVWTGLRVSDLLTLKKNNIKDGFINKDTLKTNFPVIIPIHNQVKAILKKRKGNFPRKISDVNYNKYIKEVCKEAGIINVIEGAKMCLTEIHTDGKKKKGYRKRFSKFPKNELITSHIGRRSFASNHYGKIDTLTIMKITGHKTEAQFLKYIKITPSEYAKKLKKYWENIDFNDFVNS